VAGRAPEIRQGLSGARLRHARAANRALARGSGRTRPHGQRYLRRRRCGADAIGRRRLAAPYHLQGQSLLPALQGGDTTTRGVALTETHGWKTLRTENFRTVVEADGAEMLFDLDADPHAYVDVAAEQAYGGALTDMRHGLLQRLLDRERPKARVWPY